MKPPYDAKKEARAVRGFLIALRSLKVPEKVAVMLAREAGSKYGYHARRGDMKRAREYVCSDRAEFLANELKSGLMI